jgi:hypothetical protein
MYISSSELVADIMSLRIIYVYIYVLVRFEFPNSIFFVEKWTVGTVLDLTASTNANYRGSWCYSRHPTNLEILFVGAVGNTRRLYKWICRGGLGTPYKYMIYTHSSLGAAGRAAPTNLFKPPLQMFTAVVTTETRLNVIGHKVQLRPWMPRRGHLVLHPSDHTVHSSNHVNKSLTQVGLSLDNTPRAHSPLPDHHHSELANESLS